MLRCRPALERLIVATGAQVIHRGTVLRARDANGTQVVVSFAGPSGAVTLQVDLPTTNAAPAVDLNGHSVVGDQPAAQQAAEEPSAPPS